MKELRYPANIRREDSILSEQLNTSKKSYVRVHASKPHPLSFLETGLNRNWKKWTNKINELKDLEFQVLDYAFGYKQINAWCELMLQNLVS